MKHKIPPGPKSNIPFANLYNFRQDSINFLNEIASEYGDIVHFKMGPLKVVYLNHPKYIKEVLITQNSNFVKGRPLELAKKILGDGLLTSEGDFHKRQSRILQPAFHLKMMDTYAPAMIEYASRLMANWEDGKEVDMFEEMVRLGTGIAGKTLFNVDIEEEVPEINDALKDIMNLFGIITMPLAELSLKLPFPGTFRFNKAKERLDNTIYRIIDERRDKRMNNGDFLSLLLKAQDELGKDGMTDLQIRDEALTFFLTAFDTTSLALTWTWYLLAQNPKAETKMHEEIDRVLQGRTPTADDYPQLKYTRMVFEESMRLYPPIYIISREALEDFQIGDFTVPGGSIVLMSPYLIHRDERFHREPEKFNPLSSVERSVGPDSKYAYLPFSAGARSCIGQHFAWYEGVLVLASIGQKWKASLDPNHKIELQQLINLRPKNGVKMKLHRRESDAKN